MIPYPKIPGLCERDIDLLLLEELFVNDAFRRWFISTATGDGSSDVEFLGAQRSVTQSIGESDLEIVFKLKSGSCFLLVENKVDAGFQRDQAERYQQRARDYVGNAKCDSALTILVAPQDYFGDTSSCRGFDRRLTYEQIREWFLHCANDRRAAYKAHVMTLAIEKAKLGYNPEADKPSTDFWSQYWQLSLELAPSLAMDRPGPKPGGATFISFHPPALPRGTSLIHKLKLGRVDLQLSNSADRYGEILTTLQSLLEPGMTLERANKSVAIRLQAPSINMAGSFDDQRELVVAGLNAAMQLAAWAQRHFNALAALTVRTA